MNNGRAIYEYVKGKITMKVQQFMVPVYGYLVSVGKYALTKKDRKDGQKVIPTAYVEAVAEWIAKQVEEEQ